MPFSLVFALRTLRARHGFSAVVSGFAFAGILLGVAALIVIMAVMAGLKQELHNRMLGMTGHILIAQPRLNTEQAGLYASQAATHPSVLSAAVQVQGQGLVTLGSRAAGVLVRGVLPTALPEQVASSISEESSLLWQNDDRQILIGSSLAEQLGARPGSTITLVAPQGTPTPFGFMPRFQRAQVAGVYDSGLNQYDNVLIFEHLSAAQGLLQMGDNVSHIALTIEDPTSALRVIEELKEILPSSVYFTPWQDLNRAFFEALEVERIAMFLILSLVVVVAAFNIITGQMMLVRDKVNDIAIMRAVGATRSQIRRAFFLAGALLGTLGTLAGLGTGLLIVANLDSILAGIEALFGVKLFSGDAYFLDHLPALVQPLDVGITLAVAFSLTLLACVIPAWHASRLNPIQILKQE